MAKRSGGLALKISREIAYRQQMSELIMDAASARFMINLHGTLLLGLFLA